MSGGMVKGMVKKLAIGFGVVLVLVYVLLLVVPIDPVERRPGTRLGGDLAPDQAPEWSDRGGKQIAVQTRTWYAVPHAVTTTSWIADGSFYVPCARCAGKRWPSNVARDNRVRLKIDGLLYERRAIRITDRAERARILAGVGRDPESPTAVFRMEPM